MIGWSKILQLLYKKMHRKQTFAFLKSWRLNSGVIFTFVYCDHILRQEIFSDINVCHAHTEYLEHVLYRCPYNAQTTNLYGHNTALRVPHNHLYCSCDVGQDPARQNAPRETESIFVLIIPIFQRNLIVYCIEMRRAPSFHGRGNVFVNSW